MKRSKTTKRSLLSLLGGLMLLAFVAPTALTSCQNEQPEVDLTIRMKFDGIVDAIMQMSTTLEEKLALIESAMKDGFADNQAAQELVRSALASLSGTTEQKLAAIEATVTAQTASLEMKLALIEAAVQDGFADGQAQQELLLQAVDALEGSVEEKLAAIEEAVKAQTNSLETKIGLVEAAVKEGLADSATAQDLIRTALESLGGTLEDKMAAVVSAISSQTADLSTKLGLIEAAVKEGFTEAKAQQEMIQTAIDSLGGTLEEKLAAIEKAVTSQTVSLEAKLDLVEAALTENVTDDKEAQELIQKAIESLNGSLAAKMATIERAISGQTTDLETKLAAIETALKNGIGDVTEAQGLIQQALTSLTGTETDKLDEIEKAITSQTSSLDTYLKAIETAVEKGFTDTQGKLDLIAKAVNGLGGTADEVLDKLQKAMSGQLSKLDSKLDAIKEAVTKGFVGANEALGLIKAAIDGVQKSVGTSAENLKTALTNLIKAIQDIDKVISDNVAATLTKMLDAIVNQPDYSKLLEEIKEAIEAKQPLRLEYVTKDSVDVDHKGGTIELKYRANRPVQVAVHDTCDWARIVQGSPSVNTSSTDSSIFVEVDPNKGFSLRRTSVMVTDGSGADSLKFTISQDYFSERIVFQDSGLEAYLLSIGVDVNRDGIISRAEAIVVKSLYTILGTGHNIGRQYKYFDEFQYFTGIETIPDGSFSKWEQLESITLPESITTIEGGYGDCEGIFQDCPMLKHIQGKFTQNSSVVYNKTLFRVAPAAVFDGQFIPDGVEIIGSKAVTGSKTSDVFIPSSVRKIRDKAFEYSAIEKVRFAMTTDDPETGTAYVDSIAETAFNHCFKLEKFIGPMKNGSLRVTPDCLGLYRDTTLLAFALGSTMKSNESPVTTWSIPDNLGIKKLAKGVFDMEGAGRDIQLRKLGLPSTLTHICTLVFQSLGIPQGEVLKIYFKGDTPPVVDQGAFMNVTPKTICLYVPAVLNSDNSVNQDATEKRKKLYLDAMGMGDSFFSIESYTDWPF